jgi:hypothetical protein
MKIEPLWVPRSGNVDSDYFIKCYDSDEWSVQDSVFRKLGNMWGKHSIDRFAYSYNTKCQNFNSRFWCPITNGVDAFMQVWPGHINWRLVAPPRLVS